MVGVNVSLGACCGGEAMTERLGKMIVLLKVAAMLVLVGACSRCSRESE
jgi:hypothetical protein